MDELKSVECVYGDIGIAVGKWPRWVGNAVQGFGD